MRYAVYKTLTALYDGKEVTATKSLECNTTRITNEISTLRNIYGVEIITDRISLENAKWYGSYRLVRTDKNLRKVREILGENSNSNETIICQY